MTYNVIAQDANLNEIPLFTRIDEAALNEFLDSYCDKRDYLRDMNYRWLRDYELPEYNVPYRSAGWIIRFKEAETV